MPSCAEATSFGNPAFKANGKLFVVLDSYKGTPCLWLRIDPGQRLALLAMPGWFAAPYDRYEKALCCDLSAFDWDSGEALIRASHRLGLAAG